MRATGQSTDLSERGDERGRVSVPEQLAPLPALKNPRAHAGGKTSASKRSRCHVSCQPCQPAARTRKPWQEVTAVLPVPDVNWPGGQKLHTWLPGLEA